MKDETSGWWKQALEDFSTAQFNFRGKKYKYASFLCQQAIEKAFKALLLKRTGSFRKVHDLVLLGREVELPDNLLKAIKELTLAYVYSRYPDVKQEKKLKEISSHFLDVSEEVLKWVKERLFGSN